MRRLQHNAAASAVAVDCLQLVTAELAEEVEARVVHRAVAVFRRQFALGLLAHAQNRVEQKRERREARDEQHSGDARLVIPAAVVPTRRSRALQLCSCEYTRYIYNDDPLRQPVSSSKTCRNYLVACVTYLLRPSPASVIFAAQVCCVLA